MNSSSGASLGALQVHSKLGRLVGGGSDVNRLSSCSVVSFSCLFQNCSSPPDDDDDDDDDDDSCCE